MGIVKAIKIQLCIHVTHVLPSPNNSNYGQIYQLLSFQKFIKPTKINLYCVCVFDGLCK